MRVRHKKDAEGNVDYIGYLFDADGDKRLKHLKSGYDKEEKPILTIAGYNIYVLTKGKTLCITDRFIKVWEKLSGKPVPDEMRPTVSEFFILMMTHEEFNIISPFDIEPKLKEMYQKDDEMIKNYEKIKKETEEKAIELRKVEDKGEELKKGSKKSLRKAVIIDKTSYEAQHGGVAPVKVITEDIPTPKITIIKEEVDIIPKKKSLRRRSK